MATHATIIDNRMNNLTTGGFIFVAEVAKSFILTIKKIRQTSLVGRMTAGTAFFENRMDYWVITGFSPVTSVTETWTFVD